jgi:Ni/Fe-hydrogenase subunit HybB-like protein
MVILSVKNMRLSIPALILSHFMVIGGLLLNRFNVVFLTEKGLQSNRFYLPSWQEIIVTIGLISLGIFLYKIIVINLPIFNSSAKE